MFALVFGSVAFMVIVSGVASYALFENKASNRKHDRDLAFQIAEAGINYYRWHLAHNQTDYTDGTGQPGPYVHNYEDKDGNLIGYYSLNIIPPLSGSTVVSVSSTGWTVRQPDAKRTIKIRLGAPAMTDFTFLSNAGLNFSFTTVVRGPVHSNNDIRFDGTTDSWVKSHTRVQGGGGPKTFWQYPVPPIDFYSVTTDLDAIRQLSNVAGQGLHLYSSGAEGYHLVFNGTQFALSKVNSRDCYNGQGRWRYNRWQGWYWDGSTYCYDIKAEIVKDKYKGDECNCKFRNFAQHRDYLVIELGFGFLRKRLYELVNDAINNPYEKPCNVEYYEHSSDVVNPLEDCWIINCQELAGCIDARDYKKEPYGLCRGLNQDIVEFILCPGCNLGAELRHDEGGHLP